MAEKIDITGLNIPQHVAIILDGNGRWAKKRFLPRNAGHAAGAKNVEKIIEDAIRSVRHRYDEEKNQK